MTPATTTVDKTAFPKQTPMPPLPPPPHPGLVPGGGFPPVFPFVSPPPLPPPPDAKLFVDPATSLKGLATPFHHYHHHPHQET